MENIISPPEEPKDSVVKRSEGYSKVNDKLFIAMKMNGFRQISKFAETCGYSRPFMSNILHCHIRPTLEQAEVIASKLNLRVQDVFDISDLRIPEMDILLKNKEIKNENN